MTGAARLAARAAARLGAGLVTVAAPEAAFPIYAAALTGVIVHPIADIEAFQGFLADKRRNAALIGPGAGVGDGTRARTLAILGAGKRAVLDADALTSFAEDPGTLFSAVHADFCFSSCGASSDSMSECMSVRKRSRRPSLL